MDIFKKIILSSIEHNFDNWVVKSFKDGYRITENKIGLEISIPNSISKRVCISKNDYFEYEKFGFFESLYFMYKLNKIIKKEEMKKKLREYINRVF